MHDFATWLYFKVKTMISEFREVDNIFGWSRKALSTNFKRAKTYAQPKMFLFFVWLPTHALSLINMFLSLGRDYECRKQESQNGS